MYMLTRVLKKPKFQDFMMLVNYFVPLHTEFKADAISFSTASKALKFSTLIEIKHYCYHM